MPGTRTAPTVGALTVTENIVSLGLVDVSFDTWSESLNLPGGALTDMADIEAWAVDYQAASNASLYRVTQQVVWEGAKDASNALALFRASAESGVNMLYRNALLATETGRLVAPIDAVMQGNQDIPLLSAAQMTALIAEYINLLTGYQLESAQYTGRRERRNNPRIGT
jgi:hypothetical protein